MKFEMMVNILLFVVTRSCADSTHGEKTLSQTLLGSYCTVTGVTGPEKKSDFFPHVAVTS